MRWLMTVFVKKSRLDIASFLKKDTDLGYGTVELRPVFRTTGPGASGYACLLNPVRFVGFTIYSIDGTY